MPGPAVDAGHPGPGAAVLSPSLARAILRCAQRHGVDGPRLCRGLGFEPSDLQQRPELRLSYRQTGALIRRFQRAVGHRVSGLSVGLQQTPLSWGLAGVGMLTCRTVGEAAQYGLQHQLEAGAALDHVSHREGAHFVIELRPRFDDQDLIAFLVEESFASIVAVVRSLIGPQFRPAALTLAYPAPAHAAEYAAAFQCPVRFDAPAHRLSCDLDWLEHTLPVHDPLAGALLRGQLDRLLVPTPPQSDFLVAATTFLRTQLQQPVTLGDLAQALNLSCRTATRRLAEQGVSFQGLLDQLRREQADALLARRAARVADVAAAVGFSDPSNFRRAYQRWTGRPPRAPLSAGAD